MNRYQKITGIIIKRKNWKDSDRQLTVFTREAGKIVMLAKGVRKITSKRMSVIEVFSEIDATIYSVNARNILTEANLRKGGGAIRTDIRRCAHAYKANEIIDFFLPENEENPTIYEEFRQVLLRIEEDPVESINTVLDDFINKVMWLTGYLEHGVSLTRGKLSNFVYSLLERRITSDDLLLRLESVYGAN